VDYDLENLGPERFQQIAQALLVAEFPGVTCFPVAQPDGGRDAIRVVRSDRQSQSIVYQVKFSRNPDGITNIPEWLVGQTEKERSKIKRLVDRGAVDYVLITNVRGSSHLDVGSIDRTLAELNTQLNIPVHCWWRDDINRRLDGHWDIKLRYPEILTGQDFLRLAMQLKPDHATEQRLNAIRSFLAEQYDEDVNVKFKQVELHNDLFSLFIDLPFRVVIRDASDFSLSEMGFSVRMHAEETGRTVTITNAYQESDVAGTATLLLTNTPHLSQVVVEGAPGQGKSTLAQYICQVHRIRFLNKEADLHKIPLRDFQSSLHLPFKVDLRDFASWLAGTDPFAAATESANVVEPKSLESFLARLVRHHSGGIAFSVNDLHEVSKLTPPLIALDGLDEVADIKHRTEVINAITKACTRLRETCKNIRFVITSRPAAFVNPSYSPKIA
jgi:hypothetical protein